MAKMRGTALRQKILVVIYLGSVSIDRIWPDLKMVDLKKKNYYLQKSCWVISNNIYVCFPHIYLLDFLTLLHCSWHGHRFNSNATIMHLYFSALFAHFTTQETISRLVKQIASAFWQKPTWEPLLFGYWLVKWIIVKCLIG